MAMRELERAEIELDCFNARPFLFAKVWHVDGDDLEIQHYGPEQVGYWPLFDVLV
jgi:hypothetical protein